MAIGAIIIGDEILTGRRQDKHFKHAIDTLAQRGLELAWLRYCGDDESRLVQQFREIHASGDICFSFGGIGATHDDRTRQALAAAVGRPLIRHPDAVREIEIRFGEQAYPKRILMAELAQGSRLIPNPYNRIPGFSYDQIHCLPGFPEMAWPMMEWVLDSCYADLRSEKPVQLMITLQDAHESELIDLMTGFQNRHPAIKLSSLPRFVDHNRREIELGIRGRAEEARDALEELKHLLVQANYRFTE
ncbi:MAG: competence/damage-inducible protein A [Gammaproteobacteria bacterium]|nr:MAG: competence/damage-inducible protein A [Gammaproteobacteria bacterium]